jgi:hypothetical protein
LTTVAAIIMPFICAGGSGGNRRHIVGFLPVFVPIMAPANAGCLGTVGKIFASFPVMAGQNYRSDRLKQILKNT